MANYLKNAVKLLIVVLFIASSQVYLASARDQGNLNPFEAANEVMTVVSLIEKHHPDPYHITPKSVFDRKVADLLDRKGEVSVGRQFFDLSNLVSLVFDVHTQLHVTKKTKAFRKTYPLRFKLFPDGLYIIAGTRDDAAIIGKKVITIGGRSSSSVITELADYASADSEIRKRVFAESFLYLPETYEYLNLKRPNGSVVLGLEDSTGRRFEHIITRTWDKSLEELSWDTLNPFVPTELISVHELARKPKPFFLSKLRDNYWYAFLDPKKKYMYLQINFPSQKKDGGLLPTQFHMNWSRELWQSKAEVLIIDLRNDPGGSISLGNPIPGILSTLFNEHPTLRGVAVLMGTDTVSAGVILAAQLEDAIAPVIIGEPSGSAPNMFLQATGIDLPHSNIRLEVSTDKYIVTREADTRRYIAPDVPISLTFADYLNGKDPLIEYSKTVDRKMQERFYGTASAYQPWFRESQKIAFQKKKASP